MLNMEIFNTVRHYVTACLYNLLADVYSFVFYILACLLRSCAIMWTTFFFHFVLSSLFFLDVFFVDV